MTLYIVATPIGNLQDITFRAIEILRTVDAILVEDTRQSAKLLAAYSISKKLISFHKFSETHKEQEIIDALTGGTVFALMSDAGTPLISDPGSHLVEHAIRAGIPVVPIPGPSAPITALSASGLDTSRFQFVGFLPRKKQERLTSLEELLDYPGTSIAFESPERMRETLEEIAKIAPKRKLCVARELTKKFEEIARGTAQALADRLNFRGEMVLLIEGAPDKSPPNLASALDFVHFYQKKHGVSLKDAIGHVAQQFNIPKRQLYQAAHIWQSEEESAKK
jgi:16S rRNA (cytidine1402-2'-O)-methyltransferase